jgi:hypothetical protein
MKLFLMEGQTGAPETLFILLVQGKPGASFFFRTAIIQWLKTLIWLKIFVFQKNFYCACAEFFLPSFLLKFTWIGFVGATIVELFTTCYSRHRQCPFTVWQIFTDVKAAFRWL